MTSIIAPIKTRIPAAISSAGVEAAAGGLRRQRTSRPGVAARWIGPGRAGLSSPLRLPVHAAATVRTTLASRPHGAAVVVLRDAEVAVEDRDALWRHFHRVGVRELATRVRYAVVPPGHALVMVDLELGAHVTLVELDALLGPDLGGVLADDGDGGGR